MNAKRLCLNADKTHLMITGTSQRLNLIDKSELGISMGGHYIVESEEKYETLLGVRFMPNLKWGEHVAGLKMKLKTRLSGLLSVRNVVSTEWLKKLADGIFLSVLSYCIPLWGACDLKDLRSLQILQNTAARHVLKVSNRCHREDMYVQLNWLTVSQLSVFHSLLSVYKIRKNQEPEYLHSRLSIDNVRGKIIVPSVRLSIGLNSFCWRGAILWNSLPEELRKSENTVQFKKDLKKWIIENTPRFPD